MRVRARFTGIVSALMVLALAVVTPAAQAASPLQANPAPAASCKPVAADTIKPFLKLPFREKDGAHSLAATNGWEMAADEVAIAGPGLHAAIDFEFLKQKDHGYGLPILAAASGKAYYSFEQFTEKWVDDKGIAHSVGLGAGYVIEIQHANQWVTQYIHPSKIAPKIPYIGATEEPKGSDMWKANVRQPDAALEAFGVPVTQGEVIGWQGVTGVGLDQNDIFDGKRGRVVQYTTKQWDPPQLHFQLYQGRDQKTFEKLNVVDVFGREADGLITPKRNPYMKKPGVFCSTGYFVSDKHGQPAYAG